MKPLRIIIFLICLLSANESSAQVPVSLMERIPPVPQPQRLVYHDDYIEFPTEISITGLDPCRPGQKRTGETLQMLFSRMPDVFACMNSAASFKISFERSSLTLPSGGYKLFIAFDGITIISASPSAEYYAAQTLYQILAYSYFGGRLLFSWETPVEADAVEKKYIPLLEIVDYPQYQRRSLMIDMGRSVFSKPLIERIIRIMSHLKMNMLHVHLYDDEMCGFRFEHLSLGSENPFALTADDFTALIKYARSYHIGVMPELESWGHVKSVIYHYPECYGGPGMYGGASFAIGEKTYHLLEKIYEEIILCLEDSADVHVGLDEAKWAVYPEEADRGHTPETHVGRIYDILMSLAERHHKKITMHLWADHGGRPVPDRIDSNLVIQPWKYRRSDAGDIKAALKKYGGKKRYPVMMGGGVRSVCYDGCFAATREWAREGIVYPNVIGGTVCIWGTNQIEARLVGIYAGADYLWTPSTPKARINDPYDEQLRADILTNMRKWQFVFAEALPDRIKQDEGPEVHLGRYVRPPFAHQGVTPVVDFNPEVDIKKR